MDLNHPETGELLVKKGRKLGQKLLRQLQESKFETISFPDDNLWAG